MPMTAAILTTQPPMSPAPLHIQKTQKNWRLTATCIRLLGKLSSARGVSEAAMIEMLVREAYGREYQDGPPTPKSR